MNLFEAVISVIIPTCHRNDLLARCLTALSPAQQTLPVADYEVIVSDDGLGRDARPLVQNEYPWAKWIAGPRRGPASNRNRGAKEAAGDWLAFIDDDCHADAGWLRAISQAAQQPSADVIEGKTICPAQRDDPFEEHIENLTGGLLWSCNLAIRREVFARLEGFDEDFLQAGGEDMEFAWRVRKQNLRTCFVPEALVTHPPRRITWRGIWWRTFLMRWILLYRIKTEQSLPLDASFPRLLADLVWTRSLYLIRGSRQWLKKIPGPFWRRNLFFLFWNWFTFPILLPYLLVWEIRFRRQLRERLPAHH